MQFDTTTSALIAMDFQSTIQGTLPDAGTVTRQAAAAIAATRAAGARTGFVRVAFTRDELSAFPPHSAMGQRMNAIADKVLADAPMTQVDPQLEPRESDISVRKRRVGPFSTTDLDAQLRAAGIDTLILAGIHTSGCVLSAVREAFDLDYRVVVLADACADPDPAMHDFLVEKLLPKQATVMTVADYIAAIGASARQLA